MISLQSKGLSRVFSNITVQKHQLRTLVRTLIISETFSSGPQTQYLRGKQEGTFRNANVHLGSEKHHSSHRPDAAKFPKGLKRKSCISSKSNHLVKERSVSICITVDIYELN